MIRRLTFDLTGLPPTHDEVAAFVADDRPDAYARLADRLLASPAYGERWGRHWLDLARYADSNGMDENVAYANAWRYRDYVVTAFNADLPYDRFLSEQVAGDLLTAERDPARRAALTGTGFLVLGPKMLAEDDPVKMEMDIIDEQVDTVGRVFLGLTLGCARCHDHKFDPIPTRDYYGLAGIFKSTRSMANHKVVAMWNERAVGSPEQRAALEAYKKRKIAADEAVKTAVVEAPPGPQKGGPQPCSRLPAGRAGDGRLGPTGEGRRPGARPSAEAPRGSFGLFVAITSTLKRPKTRPEPSTYDFGNGHEQRE